MIALGRELAARGHDVTLRDLDALARARRARGHALRAGARVPVFPTRERPLKPYEAACARRARPCRWSRELAPDVVVDDVLTLAPALAAELEGVPRATLVPHVYPALGAGHAAVLDRRATAAHGRSAARCGARSDRSWTAASSAGASELNETRAPGRPAGARAVCTAASAASCASSRRSRSSSIRARGRRARDVVGPLLWEPPTERRRAAARRRAARAGRARHLAGSRAAAAARGARRAGRPARARARDVQPPPAAASRWPVPANARLVDWISYSRTMPRCDVVVCHGGHGTHGARARVAAAAVVAVPAAGDMGENAARVEWARRRRAACRGACARRARSGWRSAGRWRSRGCGAGAGGVRLGREPRCAGARRRAGGAVRARLTGEAAGLPGPGSGGPGNLAR